MPTLSFEAVCKNYPVRRAGSVAALRDFSLIVPDGKLTVLLGSSGCGKTTALRLAAGLESCDAGRILLDGRDLAGTPPGKRPLALVFQNYALYPQMTAAENLAYPLRMRRVDPRAIQARMAWVAELLHLSPTELQRQPHALSGGQRQRVALGKALWESFKLIGQAVLDFLVDPLGSLARVVGDIGSWLGKKLGLTVSAGEGQSAAGGVLGPPAGAARVQREVQSSNSTTTQRSESTVTVKFVNLPAGARVRQEGDAPVDMDMGYANMGWG